MDIQLNNKGQEYKTDAVRGIEREKEGECC
jgi:hypothetical protein